MVSEFSDRNRLLMTTTMGFLRGLSTVAWFTLALYWSRLADLCIFIRLLTLNNKTKKTENVKEKSYWGHLGVRPHPRTIFKY